MMSKVYFIVVLFSVNFLACGKKTESVKTVVAAETTPHTFKCSETGTVSAGVFVERCENEEAVCYVIRESLSCWSK